MRNEQPDRQIIVHSDIKPANILITREFVAKIGDLGLVQRVADAGNMRCGTTDYMAPEVEMGKQVPEEERFKRDIYATGIVIRDMIRRERGLGGIRSPTTTPGSPAALLYGLADTASNSDYAQRPHAEAMLKSTSETKFPHEWLPEHRRGTETLTPPIGLEGVANELLPPSALSISSLEERRTLEQPVNNTQAPTYPLLDAWRNKAERETNFDDLIVATLQDMELYCGESNVEFHLTRDNEWNLIFPPECKLANLDGDARGQSINALRAWCYTEFKKSVEADMEAKWGALMEGELALCTGQGGRVYKPLDDRRSILREPVLRPFLRCLALDRFIQDACVHFAIHILVTCEGTLLSTEEKIRLLQMAKANIEQLPSVVTTRLSYQYHLIAGSFYRWFKVSSEWYVRMDFGEIRAKRKSGVQNDPHTKDHEWDEVNARLLDAAPLDIEPLRRAIDDRIDTFHHFLREGAGEVEETESRESNLGGGVLTAAQVEESIETFRKLAIAYVFNPQRPPTPRRCTCRDGEEGVCDALECKRKPEVVGFIEAWPMYEAAFRYVCHWNIIPEHPEMHLLIEELLKKAKEVPSISPYVIYTFKTTGEDPIVGADLRADFFETRLLTGEQFQALPHLDGIGGERAKNGRRGVRMVEFANLTALLEIMAGCWKSKVMGGE
ncbi:unnamed protein product, partial [Mesorhabditis spiculigera]